MNLVTPSVLVAAVLSVFVLIDGRGALRVKKTWSFVPSQTIILGSGVS